MLKRKLIFVAGALAALAAITAALNQRETSTNMQIAQLVAEKGTPTFLAKRFEVDKTDMRVLRVFVLPQDPQAVTNWNSITNVTLVWAESEPGRRNARYFYDEMKSDKSFDGSGWYSRRSLFRGEKVTSVKIDATGKASGQKAFRVDAFSMQLMGFVPRKPPATQQE